MASIDTLPNIVDGEQQQVLAQARQQLKLQALQQQQTAQQAQTQTLIQSIINQINNTRRAHLSNHRSLRITYDRPQVPIDQFVQMLLQQLPPQYAVVSSGNTISISLYENR